MMSRMRKRQRSSAVAKDAASNSTALSSSFSSTQPPVLEDYAVEDRPLLSFIAVTAAQSPNCRSADHVLQSALTLPSSVNSGQAAASPPPRSDGAAADAGGLWRYPEVRVLAYLHRLRCLLRKFHDAAPCSPQSFLEQSETHLRGLHGELPEPLFLAFAMACHSLAPRAAQEQLSKEYCTTLAVQMLHVVEATQVELLRATKLFTVRPARLTLRFHHDIPYL